MIKVFKVATIKELQKQVAVGMITYTKMVEIMNELADEAYRESQKSSISNDTQNVSIDEIRCKVCTKTLADSELFEKTCIHCGSDR